MILVIRKHNASGLLKIVGFGNRKVDSDPFGAVMPGVGRFFPCSTNGLGPSKYALCAR